jgi:hypothetical protein
MEIVRSVNWRIFVPAMLICFGIAWAIHHGAGIPFWLSVAVVLIAVIVNGWIAAVEDHW